MSTRRKSTRATNFNNIQEQQRNDKIQKRQAVRGGGGVRQQVHRVLTEAALQTVWQLYEKYANASPLLERYAEDGGGTGASAAGARRSERRRAGNSGGGAAADDDGAGGGAVKEALAGAEAAAAAEAARVWEENGHHCLDLLEPLLLPPDTAAPKHVQEALMHLVLNAEAHRTHLSARALSLLERLLERHPPVRLVGVGGTAEPGVGDQGEDEEDEEEKQQGSGGAGGAGSARRPHLEVNPDLWEPVSGTWTRAPLCGLPRLARGLRQLRGLMLLAGGAHNCVARAVEAAGHPALPRASDKDAAECGDVGQLLLLRYWVRMLCADMQVRLQAAHSSLGARGRAEEAAEAGGGAEEAEARAAVDGSLLLRLLKTADLNLGWQYETNAKPVLVRLLASTAVYGAMGARAGAVLPLPGGQGSSGAGARPGGPGGVVAVPPVVASRLLVSGGPGEVGRLAGQLLGCLAGGLAAMEAADGYSRRRSAAVAYNERVEMDRRLAKVVGKEAVYGNPDNVQALLSCLPAASCVRLLSYLVVEAAQEQLPGAAVAGAGGGGGGAAAALAVLAAHYVDGGVKDSPPPVLASPALRYLLGDQEPQEGGGQEGQEGGGREGGQEGGQEGGGGHWAWGLRCMRLNSQMPGRVGLPLLVAALAAAGWRHAEEEARRAEAHEGAGEAERQDAEEDEPGVGAGARLTAAQWRRELAAVAALSQQAAARLQAEGLVRAEDGVEDGVGAGAAAGAGVGGVGADALATYIQMRCAEQLAKRLGNPGAAAVAAV